MAFNVINLKHRDVEEAWLHICHGPTQKVDGDGNPVFDLVVKEMKAYQYANLSVGKGNYKFNLNYPDSEIDEIIHQGLTDTVVGSYEERVPVMVCEPMYADEKKKKPVRIKFKSIHSDAFRKAFFKMNIHLANLKNGKKKEYEKLASEQAEVSREQVISDITEAFLGAEDLAIDMITELAVDWEGFFDVDNKPLEFNPDYLRFVVSQPENYHVLKQIRDSFNDAEVFMEA